MKYSLDEDLTERYRAFIESEAMRETPEYSKSEYWQLHAEKVKIKLEGRNVLAEGESGFYAPSKNTPLSFLKKLVSLLLKPKAMYRKIKQRAGLPIDGLKLLDYFTAFDNVMRSTLITQPQRSSFRLDFRGFQSNNPSYASVKACRENYRLLTGGKAFSDHTLIAYYYINILSNSTNLFSADASVVLEIGGGNGNLASLIKLHKHSATLISVDLPETIAHSILYLTSIFPSAKILLPNEVTSNSDVRNYDFVFLTPQQLGVVRDNIVDVAINTHSFQEMTQDQISEYFGFIQRVGKPGSYFFTANRAEKIPVGEDPYHIESLTPPNRFSEYPWRPENEIIIYEVCRLFRLVQLDSVFNRLEKIA